MRIGVPVNHDPGERRVGITPDVAAKLIGDGHQVVVESGAGSGAGHLDGAYTAVGAEIGDPFADVDVLVCVSLPDRPLRSGSILVGLLSPFDHPDEIRELAGTGVTAFAFEAVPRTTRAQVVDVLSSQATVAGYQAVLEAAKLSDRLFPMLTTAAGTLPPAKVLVLGAGVAGLQAIATARRLGAVVSAFDVRAAAAEQVRSLGATFVEVEMTAQDAAASGGYAKEVAADEQQAILDAIASPVAGADAVICTAAIPGRPAPLLVTTEMVETMRPGAVIIDLAAATGGNCQATSPGETVVHANVTIVGDTDLISRTAADASRMLARNVAAFLALITGPGGEAAPDWDDDIVAESCVTRDGAVVHPRLVQEV